VAEDEEDEQDEAQAPGPGGGGGAEEDLQAMAEEGALHATPAGIDTATEANADDAASSSSVATVAALDQSTDGGGLSEEDSGVELPAFTAPEASDAAAGILEPDEDGDGEDNARNDLDDDADEEEADTEADSTLDTSFTETEADTSVEIEANTSVEEEINNSTTALEANSSRACGASYAHLVAAAALAPGSMTNRRRNSHRLSFAAASVQPVDFADLFAMPASMGPSTSSNSNSRRRSSIVGHPSVGGAPGWSAEDAGQGPRTPFRHANHTPRGGALLRSNLPPTPLVSAFGPEYNYHPYGEWGVGEGGGGGRSGASSTLQRRTTMETWQLDLDDMHSRATMMRRLHATHTLPPSVPPFFVDSVSSSVSSSRSLAREMYAAPGSSQRAWPFADGGVASTAVPTSSPRASNNSSMAWPSLEPPHTNQPPHSASGEHSFHFRSEPSSSSSGIRMSSSSSTEVGAKRIREVRRCEVDGDSSSEEDSDSETRTSASRTRPEDI